ncbi:MAG TPA: hypothetical protein VF832_00220, partial [Longimicrobiales bacterium]
RYTDVVMQLLGQLRPGESQEQLRVATFALFGMMNWIYNWYRPNRDLRVEELAAEMTRLFLHGHLGEAAASPVPLSLEPPPSIWRD